MNVGQKIMEGIINANLFTTECSENPEHDCITVWSSGAAEQIEAMAVTGMKGVFQRPVTVDKRQVVLDRLIDAGKEAYDIGEVEQWATYIDAIVIVSMMWDKQEGA